MVNVAIGDEKEPHPRRCYSGEVVQNIRPEFRHEGTFIDPVYEQRIHGIFVVLIIRNTPEFQIDGIAAAGNLRLVRFVRIVNGRDDGRTKTNHPDLV